MQIGRTFLAGIVLVGMAAACSPKPASFADVAPTTVPDVTVVQPDALVVDGRHVRLANATAPQLAPHAHCWAEVIAARKSRDAVQSLIAGAHQVTVTPTGGTDEYARALSQVTVDGVDLGQALLDDGLAAPGGAVRFDWCGPLSTNMARGPRLSTLVGVGG